VGIGCWGEAKGGGSNDFEGVAEEEGDSDLGARWEGGVALESMAVFGRGFARGLGENFQFGIGDLIEVELLAREGELGLAVAGFRKDELEV